MIYTFYIAVLDDFAHPSSTPWNSTSMNRLLLYPLSSSILYFNFPKQFILLKLLNLNVNSMDSISSYLFYFPFTSFFLTMKRRHIFSKPFFPGFPRKTPSHIAHLYFLMFCTTSPLVLFLPFTAPIL